MWVHIYVVRCSKWLDVGMATLSVWVGRYPNRITHIPIFMPTACWCGHALPSSLSIYSQSIYDMWDHKRPFPRLPLWATLPFALSIKHMYIVIQGRTVPSGVEVEDATTTAFPLVPSCGLWCLPGLARTSVPHSPLGDAPRLKPARPLDPS